MEVIKILIFFVGILQITCCQELNIQSNTNLDSSKKVQITSSKSPNHYDSIKYDIVEEDVRGVKTIGNYRLYSRCSPKNKEYYKGLPKIEFLGNDKSVLKTIDVLKNTTLYNYENISFKFHDGGIDNVFIAKCQKENFSISLENSKLYCNPTKPIKIIHAVSYLVQKELLVGKYECFYGLEGSEIIGSMSEVVIWNNEGIEIGRFKMEGPIRTLGLTEDNKMMYVSAGGRINEDSRTPTAFYALDINAKKISFSRKEKENECIQGGVIKGSNRGIMTIGNNCGNRRGKHFVSIFDHNENMIYYSELNKECWSDRSYLAEAFENECFCYSESGEKFTHVYSKDFKSKPFR